MFKRLLASVLGYKWIIGGALFAASAIGGYAYFLGHTRGNERGFDRALENYEIDRQAMEEAWLESLKNRDTEWQNSVQESFDRLVRQFEQYQKQEEKERELRKTIGVLASTIEGIQNEFEGSDLGGCSLSPDFDRLLQQAHTAATAGAEPRPDPESSGAHNPPETP